MNADAEYFFELLGHKEETELRFIDPHGKQPSRQIWTKPTAALKLLEENDGKFNLYAGLNERKNGGDKDADVIRIDKLFIDVDAARDSKLAATEEELKAAEKVADAISEECVARGWGCPAKAMSGNGWHLVRRFPSIEGNAEVIGKKIQKLERDILDRHISPTVKLDIMNNPSRIIKIWGTTSIKGDNTPERPWRRSYVARKDEEPSAKLRDEILLTETIEPKVVYVETPRQRATTDIDKLTERDVKLCRLLDGDETGYESTSETELALACKLVYYGFDDADINHIMSTRSRLDKWRGATDSYKKLTLKKAHEWALVNAPITATTTLPSLPGIPTNPTLEDVKNTFRKWIKTTEDDYRRIDVALAAALTRATPGLPVWIFFIGPSGDWKSALLDSFNDPEIAKHVSSITPHTLISGDKKAEDLAPKLNNKLFLIKDMAQLQSLPTEKKAMIWAQLRELYDGDIALAAGTGADKRYSDLHVTILAGATPSIDEQFLIAQNLGTRELIWRTKEPQIDKESEEAAINAVLDNESLKKQMELELRTITVRFVKTHAYTNVPVPENIRTEIKRLVKLAKIMRATAETDYDGSLRNLVYPEVPTRIAQQYQRLYKGLKSLDPEYSDENALTILHHITNSISHPIRLRVLKAVLNGNTSTWHIAHAAGCGIKTALTHLSILRAVGIIKKRSFVVENFGKESERVSWSPNSKSTELDSISQILEKVTVSDNQGGAEND